MFDVISNGSNIGTLTEEQLRQYKKDGTIHYDDKIYDHNTGERIYL